MTAAAPILRRRPVHHQITAIGDRAPDIAESAWIAPSATVVGAVTVGPGTGVFYGAVLRADLESVSVGAGSNVQDAVVVHADPGYPARIGDGVSIGHGA